MLGGARRECKRSESHLQLPTERQFTTPPDGFVSLIRANRQKQSLVAVGLSEHYTHIWVVDGIRE